MKIRCRSLMLPHENPDLVAKRGKNFSENTPSHSTIRCSSCRAQRNNCSRCGLRNFCGATAPAKRWQVEAGQRPWINWRPSADAADCTPSQVSTHQIVLWCMGEAHAGVVLDGLANRYGVTVDTVELRVPLRETFSGKAKGHGRHIKQSGGHGQYAVCDIEVEPLPEGSGFEFVDKVVGGAVPRNFIPSVEKGVRAQMEKGVHAGYPVVDIRVTLFDGKAHSVDSSDFAFQAAGALALREAAAATRVTLLEPIDEISVLVPDDFVGPVMGDLSGRRGRVLGTDTAGHERTVVKAEVPQVELTRYAIDLRSLSHGAASFTRSFARYEPMPESAAARVKTTA